MGVYDNLLTLDLKLLAPHRFVPWRLVGSGIDGGQNGNHSGQTIEMAGGGSWYGGYGECNIFDRDQHAYVNMLEAQLSGGFRYINVPIMTDLLRPIATHNGQYIPQFTRLFDPDNSLIDGATSTENPSVTAKFSQAAANYAGEVRLVFENAEGNPKHSFIFSTFHALQGWRAYRVRRIISTGRYAISPPLREAVIVDQDVRIVRPLCVMKYPANFQAGWDVEGYWKGRPTFEFQEAPVIQP